MFRIGDIVEAQVTFMVIPLKEQRRKMLPVLRSLALIKGNDGKVPAKRTVIITLLTQPKIGKRRNKQYRAKGKTDIENDKATGRIRAREQRSEKEKRANEH